MEVQKMMCQEMATYCEVEVEVENAIKEVFNQCCLVRGINQHHE
jgi:hypothetical protein